MRGHVGGHSGVTAHLRGADQAHALCWRAARGLAKQRAEPVGRGVGERGGELREGVAHLQGKGGGVRGAMKGCKSCEGM